MAEKPDFDSMTDEELADWRSTLKKRIWAAQELFRESTESHKNRVQKVHIDEAKKQLAIAAQASGRTEEEQLNFWLNEEQAQDPGHRVQAQLVMSGKQSK